MYGNDSGAPDGTRDRSLSDVRTSNKRENNMRPHAKAAQALKAAQTFKNADHWKRLTRWNDAGYYTLQTEDTGEVPVRMFLTASLLADAEDILYRQIVNATRFPGVKLVAITPDTHYGYGVPVGCVILTDAASGAVAMGPVGYDIGCGMVSATSDVPADAVTFAQKLAFNSAVMEKVPMGTGGQRGQLGKVTRSEFEHLVRGGAEYYVDKYEAAFDRSRAERHRLPVDDDWQPPFGGKGRPERGMAQLGSLGGAITSSSCSDAQKRAHCSCRRTQGREAGGTASRRTILRWRRLQSPRALPTLISAISRRSRPIIAGT
jgi:hypothetical protein